MNVKVGNRFLLEFFLMLNIFSINQCDNAARKSSTQTFILSANAKVARRLVGLVHNAYVFLLRFVSHKRSFKLRFCCL